MRSRRGLDRLLADTKACFDLSACREFTVEAGRPDTVTEEKLAVLVSHGVNRVSVNPQTMSDAVLEEIGRHHTAAQVREAVAMVKKFPQLAFNMDLIAGLPGDTPESFSDTVREVIALGAENITVHTLALKKGSRFLTEGTALPDGKAVGKMLGDAREKLEAAGYAPYYLYRQKFMSGSFENVGWTKPRKSLQHMHYGGALRHSRRGRGRLYEAHGARRRRKASHGAEVSARIHGPHRAHVRRKGRDRPLL